MQTCFMAVAAVAMGASAFGWYDLGEYASAFTFFGFGLGYAGLAVLFWSV